MLTRRRMIVALAGGAGAALWTPGARLWAATTVEMGGVRIDAVSDGALILPTDYLYGAVPQEARAVLTEAGISGETVRRDCNLTLLRDGDRTVLFDAGSGSGFMPSAGDLLDALAALEVAPADVTDVVFTHGHPDHLWGVLDDFDDLTFPEAAHFISRTEWDYWLDPETLDATPEARKAFVAGAQRRLPLIEDRVRFFEDGDEILPGVTARATPGHTAGHTSFLITQGEERLLVVGDALLDDHLAFVYPDISGPSDHDPGLAATTRRALLNDLASSGMPLLGFHLPYPGIGMAERVGDAFRFVAESP